MNEKETAQLITLMRSSYPASFTKLSDAEMRNRVLVWTDLFRDYPFEPVQRALKKYIMTNDTPFAPSPGQLNGIIARDLKAEDPNLSLDKFTAWEMVEKAMRSGDCYYEPQKAFDKLPEPVRNAVGSAGNLRKWSYQESGLDFVKKDFYDRFDARQEAEEIKALEPRRILQRLGKSESLKLTSGKGD